MSGFDISTTGPEHQHCSTAECSSHGEKKKKSLSLLLETSNSNFDSDVGIQINNTRVPRERCHQTEYICVAQTHFDCGNIKRNCFKNLVKKGSFDSVDDVKVKKDECLRCL